MGLALGILLSASLAAQAKGAPGEEAAPPGLPRIGLWMLAKDGSPADWLGSPFEGKRLLEPINVIIVDHLAASAEDASARLLKACGMAEFPQREGHSSNYSALIGSRRHAQFPPGTEESFSDALFAFSNDHGRMFGPMEWHGVYVFIGAFSRETVDLVSRVKHHYESFDRARDAFSSRMSTRAGYRVLSFVYLGNAILGDASLTTGDHDGMAVVLSPER
jgi:hypothetical protein